MLLQLLEEPWVTLGWVLPRALQKPEPLAIKGWRQTLSVPEGPPAQVWDSDRDTAEQCEKIYY